MAGNDELLSILKKLRLSGVLQTLELRAEEAVAHHLSHAEFLARVLRDEVERRDGKQLDLRVRKATLLKRGASTSGPWRASTFGSTLTCHGRASSNSPRVPSWTSART